MKKILQSLVLTFWMISVPAAGQELVSIAVPCATGTELADVLKDYQELPLLKMVSTRSVGEQSVAITSVLFGNTDTGTWTLAEQVAEDHYCVVAMGNSLKPWSSGQIFH